MNSLYKIHKADSCFIAETFIHALGDNGDRRKTIVQQRIFCEKKCRFSPVECERINQVAQEDYIWSSLK